MNNEERKIFWQTLCSLKGEDIPTEFELLQKTVILPKYLYRYRSATLKNLEALRTNRLYFSSAEYFDDPFDAFLRIDIERAQNEVTGLKNIEDERELKEFKENFSMGFFAKTGNMAFVDEINKLTPAGVTAIIENFEREKGVNLSQLVSINIQSAQQEIRKNTKAICFSEDENNEVLWIKYADQHRGFILEYDFLYRQGHVCGTEEKCQQCAIHKHDYALYPIYYSHEKYEASKLAQYLMIRKSMPPNIPAEAIQFIESHFNIIWEIERVTFIKNICHEYDKEWRVVLPHPVNTDTPALCIVPTSITLGLLMDEAERNLTITCAREAGIQNIYQAIINGKSDLDKVLIVGNGV